jgi:hypothetical protein
VETILPKALLAPLMSPTTAQLIALIRPCFIQAGGSKSCMAAAPKSAGPSKVVSLLLDDEVLKG